MSGDTAGSESAPSAAEPMDVGSAQQAQSLCLEDVLRGDASNVGSGAFLSFETVGHDTVVSIEANGVGPALSFPVATLEGVTGVTLQQLLASNLIAG